MGLALPASDLRSPNRRKVLSGAIQPILRGLSIKNLLGWVNGWKED
jgi:hypothetical protein